MMFFFLPESENDDVQRDLFRKGRKLVSGKI